MELIKDFEDMNLRESLLEGIYAYGFEEPSKIQQRAIKPIIEGEEVIAQAQSGTGKTGTYLIGCLNRIDEKIKETQILILAPTKELARQIHTVSSNLGKKMKIKNILCVGGESQEENKKELSDKNYAKIVIGTPGRVLDMIGRGYLKTNKMINFILDEADELLSRNFKEMIVNIGDSLNKECKICVLSATMEQDMIEFVGNVMNNPVKILMKNEMLTLEGIKQYYINVEEEKNKYETLCDLYSKISVNQAIIYINTKKKATGIMKRLEEDKFTVSLIHGDMDTQERKEIMREFRKGTTKILITTDLLARGIDIQQLSMVVNYDLPKEKSKYIHRIGRSGRYGRKGKVINFITSKTCHIMEEIKKYYNTEILPLPENFDI